MRSELLDKYEKAKKFVRERNYIKASHIFKELIEEAKEARIYNDASVVLYLLGELENAIELAEQAERIDPKEIFARLNRFYFERVLGIKKMDLKLVPKNHDGFKGDSKTPKVSVIVRTFKRTDLLKEALLSLRAQSFKDFETILINDGGDERAKDIAFEIAPAGIRYFCSPHSGPWSAMNYGLEMARGEYIAFLDDDDIFYPEHLEKLVRILDENKKIDFVYTDVVVSEWKNGKCISKKEEKKPEFKRTLLFNNNIILNPVLVRKKCFLEKGKFIESFRTGGDWEMWLRLSEAYNFYHLSEATCEVRKIKDRVSDRERQKKFYFDNLLLYLHKGITLFSFPPQSKYETDYEKLKKLLNELIGKNPELFSRISLRGIYSSGRQYKYFYEQGRWFLKNEERENARLFLKSALFMTKLEPKIYFKLLSLLPGKNKDVLV